MRGNGALGRQSAGRRTARDTLGLDERRDRGLVFLLTHVPIPPARRDVFGESPEMSPALVLISPEKANTSRIFMFNPIEFVVKLRFCRERRPVSSAPAVWR